jgi:hypothetical protein
VELVKENEHVARIYLLVRSQCETRWNGEKDIPVDIRHEALWKAIEKYPYPVHNHWGCFNQVIRLWHTLRSKKDD